MIPYLRKILRRYRILRNHLFEENPISRGARSVVTFGQAEN